MLEDICTVPPSIRHAATYRGPERRTTEPAMTRWLAHMLDEMDYGMLLVGPTGVLRHANQPGVHELASDAVLGLSAGMVHAGRGAQSQFLQALGDASRGRRRLLTLGSGDSTLSIAVVPLGHDGPQSEPLVLLILGKRQSCETLTLDIYARAQGLTSAETRVLQALCRGARPKEVAREFDVAVSTVRTQITSIRHKTQTASIRDLVNRIVTLPPITSAMKSLLAH